MIDLDAFIEKCKPYQDIINRVTFDECICVAMGTPIHCNREEIIVKAIIQKLYQMEQIEKISRDTCKDITSCDECIYRGFENCRDVFVRIEIAEILKEEE